MRDFTPCNNNSFLYRLLACNSDTIPFSYTFEIPLWYSLCLHPKCKILVYCKCKAKHFQNRKTTFYNGQTNLCNIFRNKERNWTFIPRQLTVFFCVSLNDKAAPLFHSLYLIQILSLIKTSSQYCGDARILKVVYFSEEFESFTLIKKNTRISE